MLAISILDENGTQKGHLIYKVLKQEDFVYAFAFAHVSRGPMVLEYPGDSSVLSPSPRPSGLLFRENGHKQNRSGRRTDTLMQKYPGPILRCSLWPHPDKH